MSWPWDSMYDQDYDDGYSEPESVWVDIEGTLRETEKAFLFLIEKGDDFAEPPTEDVTVWMPKSQIELQEETRILIPEWIANEKGLI